jgi:hypothetical protein
VLDADLLASRNHRGRGKPQALDPADLVTPQPVRRALRECRDDDLVELVVAHPS